MAEHHQIAGAPVPTSAPCTPVERPHTPDDQASEEGWGDNVEPPDNAPPPHPAPLATLPETLATVPAPVGAGTPAAAVAATLTSPTAPWWGGEAARWARNGGAGVILFVAGLYLASPAGMALLGHTPADTDQIAKDLRPVFAEELARARAQWQADSERERAAVEREWDAKDQALREEIKRLGEEQRYQRVILETLRDRRR